MLAGAAVISVSAGLLRDFLAARVQSRSLSGLRLSMFERLQRISMSFHSHERTASLLEHFSMDFAAIENAIGLAISWGILPALEASLGTGLMLWLDWRVGLRRFCSALDHPRPPYPGRPRHQSQRSLQGRRSARDRSPQGESERPGYCARFLARADGNSGVPETQ